MGTVFVDYILKRVTIFELKVSIIKQQKNQQFKL